MWRDKIESEICQVVAHLKTEKKRISVKTLENKKIILYGAGIDGIKVLNELKKEHIEVALFLDIRADLIPIINEISVYKPDAMEIGMADKTEAVIILTVKPHAPRTNDIIENLRKNGYKNIIKATDIFDFYSFNKEELSYSDELAHKILKCANLLEDEQSYQIYKGFVNSHATEKYETFYEPTKNMKYFDKDFTFKKGFKRAIDCGAYTGDTLKDLYNVAGKVEKMALFEPDMKSFAKLLTTIADNKHGFAEEIMLYPCGVWSKTEKLNANLGMGLNTHIAKEGADIIQCIALDEVLVGFRPSFLKLDVEGAEYQALLGARKMITAQRPDMVISLYHNLKDIWELPLLIDSWNLGYKYYIRAYGNGGNATMLYAFAD